MKEESEIELQLERVITLSTEKQLSYRKTLICLDLD